MIQIKISADYSKTPGGRYRREGPFSGEDFRETLLKPKFEDAFNKKEILYIDFDGCYGVPVSFLEEAFGGLVREKKHKKSEIFKNIEFKSDDQPSLIEKVKKFINEADK